MFDRDLLTFVQVACWLGDQGVYFDGTGATRIGSESARFKHANGPKPFIEPRAFVRCHRAVGFTKQSDRERVNVRGRGQTGFAESYFFAFFANSDRIQLSSRPFS